MPPNKGGNAKKEGGRAKKAENEEKKAAAVGKAKEAKEAEEWKSGSKGLSKTDVEAAKKAELAAKKAERAALLAAEEAAQPTKKAAPKAGAKKAAAKPAAGSSAGGAQAALAAMGAQGPGLAAFRVEDALGVRKEEGREVVELGAVGVEQMLEALEVVNEKTDADAVGAKAGLIEKHPERRYKAAFEAYLERELPRLKEDNQMRDILHKQFQKAPENPFNQQSVAYNATKDERVEALRQNMKKREEKYRVENE